MEKRNRVARVLVIVISIVMILSFATPVIAADGDVDVEIVVKGFDGSTGMPGLWVAFFNKEMTTSRRGTCKFRLKGLADHEMDFFSVYDENKVNYYGGATTNLILSPHTDLNVRPAGNPGVFEIDIFYTENTDKITINTIVTQATDLEIVGVDFEEGRSKNTQPEPAPEEPHPEEPHPEEPHPGEPGFEEPHPNDPDMEQFQPERPMMGISPVTIALLGAVLVLIILLIILLARSAKKNKTE